MLSVFWGPPAPRSSSPTFLSTSYTEVSVQCPLHTQGCMNTRLHLLKKLSSLFAARLWKCRIYKVQKPFVKFHICISYSAGDRLKALASKPAKPRVWMEFKATAICGMQQVLAQHLPASLTRLRGDLPLSRLSGLAAFPKQLSPLILTMWH